MDAWSIRRFCWPVRLLSQLRYGAVAALALAVLPGAAARAANANVSITLLSDYVAHGLTRSLGDPAVQAALGVSWDAGWSLGAMASTANLYPGPGVTQEYTASVGYRRMLNPDLSLDVQLSRYFYPGDLPLIAYDYTEVRTALSLRDELEFAVSMAPDVSAYTSAGVGENRLVWRAELSANYPLTRHFLLVAGAGYTDYGKLAGTGYWYGNFGVQWQGRRLTASLSVIGTDGTARRLFGHEFAGSRAVGAVVWHWR